MAVEDILIGGATVRRAPVGTATPNQNTVAWGAAWGGAWIDMGMTNGPLAWNHAIEDYDVKPQQYIGTVKRQRTNEDLMLETSLIEILGDNLAQGTGGTVTQTAQSVGVKARTDLSFGGEFTYTPQMWGFEGLYVATDGSKQPVRLYIWKATSVLNGALQFAKAAEVGIPLQIKALVDTSKAVGVNLAKLEIMKTPVGT